MSFQITEAFVQQFSTNFYELAQQRTSRLSPFVNVEEGIVGQSKSVERVGKTEAYDITSRHADTKYVETPHSRRWLDLQDKAWSDLVDEMDKIKMLADPTSVYPRLGLQALNRAKDDIIISAVRSAARAGTGSVVLPSSQKILEGGVGLTLAKLLTTKEILDASELEGDMGDSMDGQQAMPQRVLVCSSKQLTNLYGTTEIKSIDYNSVKALANGQIDTFMGFKFVRSERLSKASTARLCLAWVKPAVTLGIGKDIVSSIDMLPTKNYSVQVYARMSLGAVRVEDEGVVTIECFE